MPSDFGDGGGVAVAGGGVFSYADAGVGVSTTECFFSIL